MNEQQCYLFDLQGFLVIEDALTATQLTAINGAIDQHIAALGLPAEKSWLRFDGLLPWGAPFHELIDPIAIAPYLDRVLGDGYRLDHDYLHIIRQGTGPIGSYLHGGATPFDPCQYYHFQNGRMYNGLTAVAYFLTDVHPGEGGFGCIPGSHKSNFPLPREWKDMSQSQPNCVQAVPGRAGTAILFTEALTHGTLPWVQNRERRTLFYKYSPRPSAWSRHNYDVAAYPDLTDAQRDRLKSPGISPP
ncbi:phytanoyl-CoA dioxygenase family protein [Vacuolonema iberomarrocanum]|uniref:phytanoyl-CoA dioxygenase family protein n=1 Tax=Vacuolonema iberomarrocanum TaxID=3454632 RepID=UPI001A0ED41D|nr:phytanoyl-CoA dioxygenase family protein [filamentous cyanobacterium LEGE 07170]